MGRRIKGGGAASFSFQENGEGRGREAPQALPFASLFSLLLPSLSSSLGFFLLHLLLFFILSHPLKSIIRDIWDKSREQNGPMVLWRR
jgi:hypothetical protein